MRVEMVHRITGLHLLLEDTGAAAWIDLDAGDDWSALGPTIHQRMMRGCFTPVCRRRRLWNTILKAALRWH